MALEYYDEAALAKQFMAMRRSNAVTMTNREAVKHIASECNYEELYSWVNHISPDVYLIKAEEWDREYEGRDISPYSPEDVLDVFDEAQQQAIRQKQNIHEYD